MSIESDEELERTVATVGQLLQDIQDYVGRDFSKPCKLRFPRGYIRTAAQQRARLAFLNDRTLKHNISYTLILSDVLHWVLVRTDVAATAKEMLIKLQMFLLGSLVESITKVYLRGKCGQSYAKRTEYLEQLGMIPAPLRSELDWLWDLRNRMHLFQVTSSEYYSSDYTTANHNRAVKAFQELLNALS
ncbi:MAG: hypothetical protein QOJ02_265 [Acidobacteriota bacterium]|jgi:hypothetical protein|nr:hypothetical protein [Acidobacteriota bacterium]